MGLSNDPRDVRLGADYYQSTPTMLAVVDKGGLADKMGFKAGDRIISVSGQPIASIWDFKLMLRANAGKKLSVLVERKGKQETVGASVPSQLP
jgi:S1-C subfamily serine protease